MPFDQNDLYTVSAGPELFATWNPFTTKHDTSSFYSYEQDNLPLFDLEERTYLNWERSGYVFSSLPGLALAVSSTIPTHLAVSANTFTTVQAAIEALPEIIRQPTLLEVAGSGNLGGLKLDNIRFEGEGSLEIINRAFVRLNPETTIVKVYDTDDRAHIYRVSSLDFFNTIDDTSSLVLSAVTSGVWYASSLRSFQAQQFKVPGDYTRTKYCAAGVVESTHTQAPLSPNTIDMPFLGMFNALSFVDDTTYTTLDPSTFYEASGPPQAATLLQRTSGQLDNSSLGIITANHFSYVSISNCNGPIYLRGFIVDAADGTTVPYTHSADSGIKIYGCTDVTLENCGVMRAREIGLDIKNSNVNIRRGFAAVRNYEPLTSTTRHARKTYGIKADNSTIKIVTDSYASGVNFFFHTQMHDVGMKLSNSVFVGGDSRADYSPDYTVISFGYNKVGLELVNSEAEIDGLIESYNNEIGYKLLNSKFAVDEIVADYNQDVGLESDNSKIIYGNKLTQLAVQNMPGTEIPRNLHQVHFCFNGQHMRLLNGSEFTLRKSEHNPTKFGRSIFIANHGVETSGLALGEMTAEPGILIDNSYAEITHAKLQTPGGTLLPTYATKHAIYGALASVTNGGKLHFRGSNYSACWALGPPGFLQQKYTAGLYADNGSTILIQGPFFAGQFGVPLLATNNSVIKMSPHSLHDGSYDVSGWDLSSVSNHTSVILHSTRAGIVVDKNSSFIAENLGDYHQTWDRTVIGESVSSSDYFTGAIDGDAFGTSGYFNGGSLIFLPNPQEGDSAVSDLRSNLNVLNEVIAPVGSYEFTTYAENSVSANFFDENLYTITDADWMDKYSRGGVCVKALGNSIVDLTNVHFIPGPVNAEDPHYDVSSNIAGCGDLRIWSIVDGSLLRASYLSVSSTYPSLAGFTGPRAVFTSSLVIHPSSVSYGAFSGTPGTSSLSVLDFFGSGTDVSAGFLTDYYQGWSTVRNGTTNTYGPNTYENRGPFRLYFDVNPEARALAYIEGATASAGDNRPYQHFAQGYALSGPCSSIESFASSIFPTLYNLTIGTQTLESSGYYSPSSFIQSVNKPVATLDESAANTFANAKHCSLGIAGRPKLVDIYRATTAPYGEGYEISASGYGLGFKSTNIFDLKRDN